MSIATKIKLRRRLSEAQNHRCCYCGVDMDPAPSKPTGATLEHYQTRSTGGRTDFANCVVACKTCNHARGTLNPQKFFHRIRQAALTVLRLTQWEAE